MAKYRYMISLLFSVAVYAFLRHTVLLSLSMKQYTQKIERMFMLGMEFIVRCFNHHDKCIAGDSRKESDNKLDAFLTALILVAGHMCPLLETNFSSSELFEVSWLRCIFLLKFHSKEVPSCEKAIFFLESLKAQVLVVPRGDVSDALNDGTY
jgi:hypothetical protein